MTEKFNFDAPDCTCDYRNGLVARNMCGHTPPCPVYERWNAIVNGDKLATAVEQSVEAGKARQVEPLYQLCQMCNGDGEFFAKSNIESESRFHKCSCKTLRVAEIGVTAGQLNYLVKLDLLRQEQRITAAMIRDGRLGAFHDLLAACKAVLSSPTHGDTPSAEAVEMVRAAVAKAEGGRKGKEP